MTNAEKYQEVFGFPPLKLNCITEKMCPDCPIYNKEQTCVYNDRQDWWNAEYKGNNTVKVEITEHHTFAKPDDVSDIKFGD